MSIASLLPLYLRYMESIHPCYNRQQAYAAQAIQYHPRPAIDHAGMPARTPLTLVSPLRERAVTLWRHLGSANGQFRFGTTKAQVRPLLILPDGNWSLQRSLCLEHYRPHLAISAKSWLEDWGAEIAPASLACEMICLMSKKSVTEDCTVR